MKQSRKTYTAITAKRPTTAGSWGSLIIVAAVIVFFAALLGGVFIYSRKFTDTAYQETALPPGKQTAIDVPSTGKPQPSPAANGDKDATPGAQPPAQSSAKIEILEASQSQDKTLVVKTAIYGATTGTCQLTLTVDGSAISRTADVLFQPEYSTCTGFAIPAAELPKSGAATLEIKVVSGSATVASTTKQLTVEK